MADVITRFKLETTQYDSKLRDSVKSLKEVANMAELAGKDFKGFDKSTLEAARALGKIETGANNSKDKVRELVGAFNDMAKTYNTMSQSVRESDVGKALADSMGQLQVRIKEAKQELYSLNNTTGGGLFSGLGNKMSGALQVFAGNMMTKAAGAVANLGSEMVDMVRRGVELARQGEGIRVAFERLGRGDILDGLRKDTHGTVTDLELMKAAVKFNDFKLPVEELGTMLAFAQQKAKDTGQSVDYMVDSIVTGLGRKSLMILDNLGLSATEVKEKMKETGDMTKAVGEIIRNQMSNAGDYVETAADRAAQASVSLQNKMEELGRKFAPLQEASNNLWTSMKIGILDIVGGPLTDFINKLTEAGRVASAYGVLGGNAKVGRMTANLANAKEENRQSVYQQQQQKIWQYINRRETYMKDRQRWINNQGDEGLRQKLLSEQKAFGTNNVRDIQAQIDAAKKMLSDYQKAAKNILSPIKAEIDTSSAIQDVNALKVKLAELEAQRKKAIKSGDTELSKNLLKQINQTKADIRGLEPSALKTTSTQSKPQHAQAKFEQAEKDYQQALEQAAMELKAGTITNADAKKKELQAKESLWKSIGDAREIYDSPKLQEAQKNVENEIIAFGGVVKSATDAQKASEKAARELEAAQKKLADAQQKLADASSTGSATAIYKAQQNVEKQQKQVSQMQSGIKTEELRKTPFENLKQTIRAEIQFDQMKVDETTLHNLLQTALSNGLESLTVDYAGLQEKIAKGIDIPGSTWKELQDEINARLKEMGIDPIQINLKTGGIGKVNDDVDALKKTISTTASVVSTIGTAFNAIQDPAAKVSAVVAQAIANVALAYSDALAKTEAEKFNIWSFIAAAAASTVSMVSTIASIHSATGYSDGGIIKGNSYSGDHIGGIVDGGQFVGLNAGELVLNKSQQATLANNLQGNGLGGMSLKTKVKGTELLVWLDNSLAKSGRGELVTWGQ